MRAMRSPTSPVSAWYARLCLSCKIQVVYSVCRMRLSATGLTLPWQLVAAQEPGPIYFIGSAVGFFVSACSVPQKIASRENQAVATKCVLESVLIRPGEIASLLISLHRCQVNETPSNWSASEQPSSNHDFQNESAITHLALLCVLI